MASKSGTSLLPGNTRSHVIATLQVSIAGKVISLFIMCSPTGCTSGLCLTLLAQVVGFFSLCIIRFRRLLLAEADALNATWYKEREVLKFFRFRRFIFQQLNFGTFGQILNRTQFPLNST